MMRVGFAILAHERLDRVAALARHLTGHGAPVAVHVDARVRARALEGTGAEVLATRKTGWGGFGLVEAALDCARALLAHDLDHICLLSGACLPIRPIPVLAEYLVGSPDTDFIDSVPAARGGWVVDGLAKERFTLFHPFSHRRTPRLFSASVEVQRALRVRRRLPAGLSPHLGLQWWCLSVRTLRAILGHPDLPGWKRFFRRVWIPDESFFQTVVRFVRPWVEPAGTLHLNRFDRRGQPHVFHDDHLALLSRAGRFLARKIDPDAGALYRHFLGAPADGCRDPVDEAPFIAARRREQHEGRGLLSPGRYPGGTTQSAVDTACPYLVLAGDDLPLLARARAALQDVSGLACHGVIFGVEPAAFAGGEAFGWGNLGAGHELRDYRPAQALSRLVWGDRQRGRRTGFLFTPVTEMPVVMPRRPNAALGLAGQIAGDGNARIVTIGDAAGLLYRMRLPLPARRRRAGLKPRDLWAWHAAIDAGALARDLDRGGSGAALRALRRLAGADWVCPTGWRVPPGSKLTALP